VHNISTGLKVLDCLLPSILVSQIPFSAQLLQAGFVEMSLYFRAPDIIIIDNMASMRYSKESTIVECKA